MKIKISVVLSLFILIALSLNVFSPTGFAQKKNSPVSQKDSLDKRIRRVENGLLTAVLIKGEPNPGMNLVERMQFYKVPAVSIAVINNGKIEWARGYGVLEAGGNKPVTPETLFQAASISKPVTAIAAMRLVQEGKLNLDEDVNKKLVSWKVPENEFTKEQKVTLRGLLTHTASVTVGGFEGYSSDKQIPTLLQILNGTAPANSRAITVDGVPNQKVRYSGGGYVITQQLLTDVTKKPFPEFMKETIFKKLGMNHSTFQQPLPAELRNSAAFGYTTNGEKLKGNWYAFPEMTAAGLWTTPSDLARLAIEIQESKAGKSNKILSTKMVNEMLTPQTGGRGIGFVLLGKDDTARFLHGGTNNGYISALDAYTNSGRGVVVMTNSDAGSRQLLLEIMRSIAKEYGWTDNNLLPEEKPVASIDSKIYDNYVGQYQIAPDSILTITSETGKLMMKTTDQPKLELFPESETIFFAKIIKIQIKFVKDSQGKVTGLVQRQGDREISAQKTK